MKTWYKVKWLSADNHPHEDLFEGDTPADALALAKQMRRGCKGFKVLKTAYDTYGDKITIKNHKS